jgi:hypothetical protein
MKFEFSEVYRSAIFRITLFLLVALNIASGVRFFFFAECCDQSSSFGFPFPIQIGAAGEAEFYLLGLLLDVAIALTVAVLFTWLSKLMKN